MAISILTNNFVGDFMRSIISIAAACAAFTGLPAFAQEAGKQEAVRIEMDEEAKAFVFIIDDEPVALLDKHGLEVIEHLSYGGTLTDKGRESARRDVEQKIGEAADE